MLVEFVNFISAHYEKIAAIAGGGFLICAIFQHPLAWLFGGTHSLCMLIVYFQKGIIYNSLLMVYFIAIAIYGFFKWIKKNNQIKTPVTALNNKSFIYYFMFALLSSIILYLIIINFSIHSNFPILDSFITAISIFASYLQARKKIQFWFFWLVADIFRIILASYADLYWILGLNIFSIFVVFYGYRMWNKEKIRL